MRNFLGSPLFEVPLQLIIKKSKLNQTKIKLKQEIKIKTNLKIKQKDMDLIIFKKTKSIKKIGVVKLDVDQGG